MNAEKEFNDAIAELRAYRADVAERLARLQQKIAIERGRTPQLLGGMVEEASAVSDSELQAIRAEAMSVSNMLLANHETAAAAKQAVLDRCDRALEAAAKGPQALNEVMAIMKPQ